MTEGRELLASVVILAYNGRKYLDGCLTSLLDQDLPRDQYEIIVVDNASNDGSADYVEAHYPEVRVVRNEQNLGDPALTEVFPLARGRYLAYLSQDIVVHRQWLSRLVGALQRDPQARLATSNIYFTWWPEYRDLERVRFPSRAYVCNLTGYGVLDYYSVPLSDESVPIPVLAADTAAAAIDRRVVDELGYVLDEDFFMYGDVIDVCLRINSMGRKVLFVPTSVAYNASDWELKPDRRTLLKAVRSARNNLLAFYKVSYGDEFLALLPRLLMGHLHRARQHGLSRWRNLVYPVVALPVALLGLMLAVLHSPRMELKRRLALQKRTTRHNWLVDELRNPGWEPDPTVWLASPDERSSRRPLEQTVVNPALHE